MAEFPYAKIKSEKYLLITKYSKIKDEKEANEGNNSKNCLNCCKKTDHTELERTVKSSVGDGRFINMGIHLGSV